MKKMGLLGVLVSVLVSLPASAVVVQTNYSSYGSQNHFPVSATDLVNNDQSTLSQMITSISSSEYGASLSCLDDGTIPNMNWSDTSTWGVSSNPYAWDTTFFLNTSLQGASNGYNISEIDTYAGWCDVDRSNQRITISYRKVGETEFTELGFFTNLEATGGDYSTKINLMDDAGGYFLTGIDAIRFNIYPYEMMKEIDVMGSPVPEPLSLALMAIGGVMLRRKVRI
jgi:hypothetical protein